MLLCFDIGEAAVRRLTSMRRFWRKKLAAAEGRSLEANQFG